MEERKKRNIEKCNRYEVKDRKGKAVDGKEGRDSEGK